MTNKPPVSKRQAIREGRARKQRQQRMTMIIAIVVLALVVVGLFALPAIITAMTPVGEVVTVETTPRPQADDSRMGDPNAPVKIVEFSDFQCPYCKQFADETEQQIVDAYVATGKVYFEFRSMGNWVSDNIGQGRTESRDAAEAAYCAGEQNKFWEYKDFLFANWLGEDAGSFTNKRLVAFGEALELDMAAFNACLDANTHRARVNQDRVDGTAAGITGTPSFLINGEVVQGAQPFSEFQRVIEAALATAGQ